MADEAVNNFLGTDSDPSVRGFLKSTKDVPDSADMDLSGSDDADDSGSTADAVAGVMAGLGQDLHDILTLVGGVQQDQSKMQTDYATGVSQTVGDIGDAIADHYNNTTYHEILNNVTDDDGNITPESAAQAENGDNSGADPLQTEEENILAHIGDPSYDLNNQPQDTFQANLRRDVDEWGQGLYQDVTKLAGTVYDELTATSLQQLQQLDDKAGQNLWDVYSDVARPAGMVAMTPLVPAPIRAIAGAVFAPKMISDTADMYLGHGTGDDGGQGEGGLGAVVQGMVVQPLNQLIDDIQNPGQLIEDIKAHPANLWDRVLMPATLAEGGYHGARAVGRGAESLKNRVKNVWEKADEDVDTTPPPVESAEDIVQEADDAAAESGGYDGDGAARIDTGHGDIDAWIDDAAAQYDLDPVILHKMAQQESHHGELDSNVMQVLDSTGRAMGYDDVSDPRQSIYAGAKYLRTMLDQDGGDYNAAIRDYNGGGDPQYLEHVMGQPDYQPGRGGDGGYVVPETAEYTLEPGVNHEGFDEGTEAKLRLLDKWYAEETGGEHLDISSMRDGTHSDPNHAAGKAADIVNDRLTDPDFRAKFTEKCHELGFKTYDEFDRSNWTENTTGYNFHISDDGTPLSNIRRGRSSAAEDSSWLDDDDSSRSSAAEPDDEGPLRDVEGNPIYMDDEGPQGRTDEAEAARAKAETEDMQEANAPAKIQWGEGKTAQDALDLDNYIESLEQERQRMIDEEVRLMQENPGGKGVDIGYTTDDRGNINGRWAQSNNPQWYQDAYKQLGRKPTKADLPFLAESRLHDIEEFDTLDRELSRMRVLRDYMREHPEESFDRAMDQADAGTLVQGEKQIKKGRTREEELAQQQDDARVIRGDEAQRNLTPGHIYKQANNLRKVMIRDIANHDFTNKSTGIVARLSKTGIKKMLSARAIAKSIRNGFSGEEHIQAVSEIRRLFEDAILSKSHPDIHEARDIKAVQRFRVRRTNGSIAKITVKQYHDEKIGRRIYTLELEALEKPEGLTNVPGQHSPSSSGPHVTEHLRAGTAGDREVLTSSVSQPRTNVNENPLVQGESNAPVKLKPGERPAPVPDREGRLPTATLGPKKPKGHFKGDRVTREEIFERARELFGAIRTGRTGRGLNGQYDRGADVARTAQYGQFDTMWHEIGHKIDLLLGLTDKAGHTYDAEFKRVLDRKYPDGFLNHYRLDELQPEGIAEFLKEYMYDRAEAKADFPTFYDYWEKEVGKNKDLAARVSEMREMMEVYYKQPLGAQILSTIHSDKPPTIREKIQKVLDDIMINWVDDKWGIKKAEQMVERIIGRKLKPEESAYTYARIAKDRGASAAMQLLTGEDAEAVTKALNKIYGGVLKKSVTFPMVLEKIQKLEKSDKEFLKKNNFKDYQEALSAYLIARRFMEVHDLKAKGRRNYQMPRSYDEYKQFVDGAPQGLKDAAQDIYDLNRNILAIMHHEGMLSDKLYAKLLADHKHYVSLARTFEDDASASLGFGSSDGFINVSNNLKKLTDEGSVRDVKDPLQTIPQNIARSLIAVERNKVAQKFVAHSELYGTGGVIEKVSGNAKPKDSSFNVWQDGKQVTYDTTPEIYQAMQSLKPDGMDNLTHLLLKMPSNVMRAGAVVYNPAFLAKNLGRDQLTAYLNSRYGYKPFYDMAKGMLHLLRKDDMYHEFVTSGALMSAITQDAKTMVPELAKAYAKKGMRSKIFKAINPAVSLPALSEFIEQSTRMGLYGRARKHGATITEATMEARESTLDFGRAGRMGRKWNRYIPFFNAVIQDPVIFMERIRENPARMMMRSAPMIMGSLALYALIQSNDQTAAEYDEMMPYEKNMFWNIPVPKWVSKTGWVRYPKPFGPGFLFGSLPERIADMVKGKDKTGKGMKEWAKGFLEGFNPVSLPPLIQAVYEWQANYSFFRERSIVPQREAKLPEEQQYGPTTSEVAKFIGEHFGLSPRKVDNLGQNLAAGAWTQGNNFIDTLAGRKGRNLNPLKSLTVDPYSAPQSIQDFYDHMDKAESSYYGEKNTKGHPTAKTEYNHKLMNHAQKQMSDLNKKERAAIQKGDQDAVDAINKQQLKVARDALKMYKE
ncbi:LPD38 domain-containing protein [Mitsuokella multacida]|uniref:LPD38 domain-containing protein n=1 Tax=Mitsuokella multacida TaxID=52226 RepID=UPI0026653D94|nr:LPD38 domain-containing protein [Mitsuokella multacida]